MRILIAGCGYVGARLAEQRARSGDRVFAMRRSRGNVIPGVRAVVADLTDPASLDALPEVDAVVFAPTADTRDESGYVRTYVAGAENLARTLCRGTRPTRARWIHVSSTAVFEDDDGVWVDEQTPLAPAGYRARRLLESERVPGALGLDAVALRLGGIYGPGREGLIRRVEAGTAEPKGRYTNRIHRDDAAAAIGHLLDAAGPAPVFVGVDRAPSLDHEVMAWIARRLGVPEPELASGGPPGGKRCRSQALVESGFRFRYPSYVEGYGALIEARGRSTTG